MVRKYLLSLSERGSGVNTTVLNAAAKALVSKYPHVAVQVDIDSSRWAKSLFPRMNFAKRRKTSSKADIPDGARKEIVSVSPWHCIKSREIRDTICLSCKWDKVFKIGPSKTCGRQGCLPNFTWSILEYFISIIDQTPSKYVPVGSKTIVAKGERPLTIKGSADKRSITGPFAISFDGNFLPVQIIYGGKTTRSLQRFVFLKDFNLSKNPKHLSDTAKSLKFLKEVVKPYVNKNRSWNALRIRKH